MATNPRNRISSQPRKTRKAFFQATLRERKRTIRAHLSDELMEKYDVWTINLRKGDTVKVMRGGYRGHIGKVSDVDTKNRRVYIEKVTAVKADGKEKPRPLHPSNLLVTKLELTDPRRKKRLDELENRSK